MQKIKDDLKLEQTAKDRMVREKEIAIAEKFTVEQNLSVSVQNLQL